MTVLGKGRAAGKHTTGSSYVASGLNAQKTTLLAVTLQLDDITVTANRKENTIPSWSLIITRVTVVTQLLCCNLVTVITLAPIFRLSGVITEVLLHMDCCVCNFNAHRCSVAVSTDSET
jgi:hypothetical protein